MAQGNNRQYLKGEIVRVKKYFYKRKKMREELDKEKRINIINDFLDEKIQYFERDVKEIRLEQQLNTDSIILDTLLLENLI